MLLAIPLDHPPGSAYSYSNAGYSLLAAVVERASESTFENYVRSRLFGPAGLRATQFVWEADLELDALIAVGDGGYEGRFRSGDPRTRPEAWLLRGSGSVLSNTRELWRWEQALTEGRVLSADSLSTMFYPHTTAEADFLHYGYGWRIQRTSRDTGLVWHSGWEEAFSAVLRRYVDEEVVVIFTSNASVGLVPLREIVLRSAREGALGEILFEGKSVEVPRTTDASPESMRPFVGWYELDRYELDRGGTFQVILEYSDLVAMPAGQQAVEALGSKPEMDRAILAEKSREALELAELVRPREVDAKDDRLNILDPYGFAGVRVPELRAEWRKLEAGLGSLDRFEVVGTAPVGLEGREVPVTLLRLHFEAGSEDYRLVWYADDEVYLLNGAPKSFRKLLRRVQGSLFLHYDLLSGRSFAVDFEAREGQIVGLRLTVDDATSYARRAD